MAARRWSSKGFDVGVFLAGSTLGLFCVLHWALAGTDRSLQAVAAIPLVAVLSRYPLVLRPKEDTGDVVIGFEASALVFLVLTVPVTQALAFWSIGELAAQALTRTSMQTRLFNIGVTILGGGAAAWVATLRPQLTVLSPMRLGLLMLGCSCYFLFDLLTTSVSLAIEHRTSLRSAAPWRSMWLGLACFVGVDTLGYLAALLDHDESTWTLALLLVPIGTILVAVRSVSQSHLAQLQLSGLFEAATEAPDWLDTDQVERVLTTTAQRILRRTRVTFRAESPPLPAIGALVSSPGAPDRYLVAEHTRSPYRFDNGDRQTLTALAALGQAALHRQRMTEEMTYLARHDVLTGLANRVLLAERLDHALSHRRTTVALLYCDLDGFKAINDRYGHTVGDRLLVTVAQRLKDLLRAGDTAARIGGDEFAILVDDAGTTAHAEQIADRILESLRRPFHIDGATLRIGVSIGIAVSSGAETGEELLRDADTAMYYVKSRHRGGLYLFHTDLRSETLRRLELQDDLRQAIDEDRIEVHYQPVVQLATGRVEGFEALARWTHPRLGAINPEVFIPLAEQMGLISRLGHQVLRKSVETAREMAMQAERAFSIAVNVSPLQLEDADLVPEVANLARAYPLVSLVLELTESTMIGDSVALDALTALRDAGAVLAVDDFGVGYSSVSYLHRLPVDMIKVDRSFVSGMSDPRTVVLVEGIIAMATAMNLGVIAEGIEDTAAVGTLAIMGCQLGQGFLFGRPLPRDEAISMARQGLLSPLRDLQMAVAEPA
ncbi:MAG TPA: EAL domain-containing protein [Mycobacteriales bacterium]|nr:EAL domain-containing protein [Mycobacteriales bacterium]